MRNYSKLLLGALAASVVLGAVITTASARRLATDNPFFRVTWSASRPLIFSEIIRCQVTMEGSFHSKTLSKVGEALVGYVTRATVALPCTGGSARILGESLPWHIRYDTFGGTLPEIHEISFRFLNVSWETWDGIGGFCLYRTSATQPARGRLVREAGSVVTTLEPERGAKIPKTSGGLCSQGELGGQSQTFTLLGAATAIHVSLVE